MRRGTPDREIVHLVVCLTVLLICNTRNCIVRLLKLHSLRSTPFRLSQSHEMSTRTLNSPLPLTSRSGATEVSRRFMSMAGLTVEAEELEGHGEGFGGGIGEVSHLEHREIVVEASRTYE